ncbi:helix-turn-helix domain-containing protein [Acidobacteriota bacterium]
MSEFIQPKDAAKRLGCSKRHIYNLIYEKKLAVFKEGIVRIYQSSFEEYLRKHSKKSNK